MVLHAEPLMGRFKTLREREAKKLNKAWVKDKRETRAKEVLFGRKYAEDQKKNPVEQEKKDGNDSD